MPGVARQAQTANIDSFGGLDLASAPEENRGAIDLLNVVFDQRGSIRTRTPSSVWRNNVADSPYGKLHQYQSTSATMIAGYAGGLRAVTPSSVLASYSAGVLLWSAANLGTPNSSTAYCSVLNGATNLTEIVTYAGGGSFSLVAAAPRARLLAVTPWDSRMVYAGFTGAAQGPSGGTSSPSHVYFSDPGLPDTIGTKNYVQLDPGDGEAITAVVPWRDLLFVFKETKFFVFTGTSTDGTGQPIFNYRAVRAGEGCSAGPSPTTQVGAATSARTGLFFVSRNGIFRTTGGEPVRMDAPVNPLLTGGYPPYVDVESLAFNGITTCASADDLVLFGYSGSGTSHRTLAFDEGQGTWTILSFAATGIARYSTSGSANPDRFLISRYNSPVLEMYNEVDSGLPFALRDAGNASYSAYYRSGFNDFGLPGEKVLRQTEIVGQGNVALGWTTDMEIGGYSGANVSFIDPAAPVLATRFGRRLQRVATRGGLFSFELASPLLTVDGVTSYYGFQIDRLHPELRNARGFGEHT